MEAPSSAAGPAAASHEDGTKNADKSASSGLDQRAEREALPVGASSAPGPPTPSRREAPRSAGGRSVKSIVAWLESSGQPGSPTSSRGAASERRQNPPPAVREPAPAGRSFPHAPDIEEYSLTYLKYKKYFTEKPLARCLDGVTADLSQIPLEEIFENAGKNTERAVVTVDMSGYNNGGESSSSVASARAAHGGSGQGHAAEKAPAGLAGSGSAVPPAAAPSGRGKAPEAAAGGNPGAAEGANTGFVQRDAREAQEFWDDVRSYLHISDDELDSDSESHGRPPPRSVPSGHPRSPGAPLTSPGAQPDARPAPGRAPRRPAASRRRARRQLALHEPIAELDEDEAAPPVQPSMATYERDADSAQRGGR